jgi:hypothetical protein
MKTTNWGFGRYVYDIGDDRKIHTVPDTNSFVISECDCWRPGSYDSMTAAEYAFQFRDEELERLQQLRNQDSGIPIALSDLLGLRANVVRWS